MRFIFIYLTVISSAYAQIIQTREVEVNSRSFEVKKVKVKMNYVSAQKRDRILESSVPGLVKNFDEVDRDIFYKSILNYQDKDVLAKYPQLTKSKLMELREKFKIH